MTKALLSSMKEAVSPAPPERRARPERRAANTSVKPKAPPVSGTQKPVTGNRAEMKSFTVWQPPEVRKQLNRLALDMDTTAQALFGEALNLMFSKYGKSAIALTDRE